MLQHNATHDAATSKQLMAKYDYLNLLKIELDNQTNEGGIVTLDLKKFVKKKKLTHT
jgi:hypothetical protein